MTVGYWSFSSASPCDIDELGVHKTHASLFQFCVTELWFNYMATEHVFLVASEHSALIVTTMYLKYRILANLNKKPVGVLKWLLREEFDSACLREGDDVIL